jgi:type IV pilus assembly protein PilC
VKTFKYSARREQDGKTQEGVAEANTQGEAIEHLRQDGLIVTTIEAVSEGHDIEIHIGSGKIKDKALAIVCNQLSIILHAGIPIVRTLELIAEQTEDRTLKAILSDVAGDVAAGYGLADSFQKHGKGLPTTFIESVRAAESSGELDSVFARLSDYYEKTSRSKGKAKSAMIYPSFVLGIAVIVVAIIIIVAVPTFRTTFQSMGAELPIPTLILIGVSDFFTQYFLLIAGIIVGIVVAVQVAKRRNENFRLWWSHLGVSIPVIGRINLMSCASQYAGTMSIMMAAGLSIVNAVEITARTIDNYFMSKALADTKPDVEAGRPLAEALGKSNAYPDLVTEMTGVGEQTGELEDTLRVVGDYYDNEVETATDRAISMLEPITIVILAVIVCVILLAVYLPMFSIYGSYNNAT